MLISGHVAVAREKGISNIMKDMMEILRKAKCKSVFENQKEFQVVLTQMQLADAELRLDWDDAIHPIFPKKHLYQPILLLYHTS